MLRALRAHDTVLAAHLDAAAGGGTSYASAEDARRVDVDPRLKFLLPERLHGAFVARLVRETSPRWEQMFGVLTSWVDNHGGATLVAGAVHQGQPLGSWVGSQRHLHRRGRLAPDRCARLGGGARWLWSAQEAGLQRTVQVLRDLAADRGSLAEPDIGPSVLDGHRDGENRPLALGVARLRQAWRDGTLPGDVATALGQLPGFTFEPLHAENLAMVEALRSYVDWEGHANVPDGHHEDGLALGAWLWSCRLRRVLGSLAPALEAELLAASPPREADGALLWMTSEAQWRAGMAALQGVAARTGTAWVDSRHHEATVEGTVALGQWCAARRHERRSGQLAADREAALQAMPGWQWSTAYAAAGTDRDPSPLELGPRVAHGSPLGWDRGCGCPPCAAAGRDSRRARAAARDVSQTGDSLAPVLPASRRVKELRAAGFTATVIAAAAAVRPVDVRRLDEGHLINAPYELVASILAVTPEACAARLAPTGSRGRPKLLCTPAPALAPRTRNLDDSRWQTWFDVLEQWARQQGHTNVPADEVVDGQRLGGWVREQRSVWADGRMQARRATQLDALPGWAWRPRSAAWEASFALVLAYAEEHGHARVPQSHRVDPSGYCLGAWVAQQRRKRNTGNLSPALSARLETVPGWTWDAGHDSDFEAGLTALTAFLSDAGHACPTAVHVRPDGFKLGRWVANTRHRRESLEGYQVRRLEALPGWTWDPFEDRWQRRLAALKTFIARTGHCLVPAGWQESAVGDLEPQPIGAWVAQQRTAGRENMPPHRRAALEALPGWTWDGYEARRRTAAAAAAPSAKPYGDPV